MTLQKVKVKVRSVKLSRKISNNNWPNTFKGENRSNCSNFEKNSIMDSLFPAQNVFNFNLLPPFIIPKPSNYHTSEVVNPWHWWLEHLSPRHCPTFTTTQQRLNVSTGSCREINDMNGMFIPKQEMFHHKFSNQQGLSAGRKVVLRFFPKAFSWFRSSFLGFQGWNGMEDLFLSVAS